MRVRGGLVVDMRSDHGRDVDHTFLMPAHGRLESFEQGSSLC